MKLGFPCGVDNSKASKIVEILNSQGIPATVEPGKHGITVTYNGDTKLAIQANRLVNGLTH